MTKVYSNALDLITFTRASGGTYLDSDGLLKTATNNIPRIEYAADGTLKGLLVEEQRTNLLTYSEDFTNASWTKNNSSIASVAITAPDGSATVAKFTTDSGQTLTSVNGSLRKVLSKAASTITYTFSCFVRQADYDRARLTIYTGAFAGGSSVVISLVDGSNVSFSDFGSNVTGVSYGVENIGSSWWRVSIVATVSSAVTDVGCLVDDADSTATTGNGTSGTYIWGAQLEAGAFPTSYIPTSGATATRSADIASIPVSDFGYNPDAGSLFVEWERAGSTNPAQVAATMNPVSAGAYIALGGAAGWYAAGVSTTGLTSDTNKHAVAFDADGNFVSCYNGAAVQSSASSDWAGSSTSLYIGNRQGAARPLNGHIKSIKYYPRRLSNAQLQELTT